MPVTLGRREPTDIRHEQRFLGHAIRWQGQRLQMVFGVLVVALDSHRAEKKSTQPDG
jgi:hypothetical protein